MDAAVALAKEAATCRSPTAIMNALEALADALGVRLKGADKKTERSLLHAHKKGMEERLREVGAVYILNAVGVEAIRRRFSSGCDSLKAPGFNPSNYKVISWFQNLLLQIQVKFNLLPLRRGATTCGGFATSGARRAGRRQGARRGVDGAVSGSGARAHRRRWVASG
jgi:hypothetical protein